MPRILIKWDRNAHFASIADFYLSTILTLIYVFINVWAVFLLEFLKVAPFFNWIRLTFSKDGDIRETRF